MMSEPHMKTHRIAAGLLCLLLIAVATPLLLAEDTTRPLLAKQANKTNLSVEEFRKAGKAAEVAKDWTQAINIWTQLLAIQPDDVEALLGRSDAQSELGQPALGLADDRKAVELAPDNIRARNSLCWHSISAGEWGQARTACERSHALAPDIMATNINLGHTYFLQGDLATAQQWYDKTIPLLESEDDLTAGPLGDFDLFIRRGWQVEASNQVRAWFADQGQQWLKVIRLNQQVLDLYRQGKYAEALPIAQQALAICEKVFGAEHPIVATGINNLARLYDAQDRYAEAKPLHKRVLAIREKVLGPEHPDTAQSLNNLAFLYKAVGSYDKAEPLYRRSLSIREKVLGTEHPDTAYTLNDLALMYHNMGAYDKAEPLYRRALAICEKTLGPEHPDTAASLNNLASLYYTTGSYEKAESLYRRSLAIYEKALGPEHPSTATALNNLAELYHEMGSYDKAEPLYRRSLAIRAKTLGPEHPDTAGSLNNLASLYKTMGSYDKAEPLYRRSLAIHEKALGPEHPSTALSLSNLALLYAAQGRSGEALTLMERSQESDRKQIEQILGFAPEAQQTKFLATRENNLFAYISLIRQQFPDNDKAIRNALDVWLARKGILLEAQKRIKDVLSVGDNPQAQEIFANLILIRQELAMLVLGGQGKEGPEAYQKRIVELTAQKETLEGQLSRLSQAFAQQRRTRIATTSTVASALPKGAILIEMARMKDFDVKTGTSGTPRYLAFVLSSGKNPDVSLVDLGDADNIDQQTASFKKSLGSSKTLPDVLAKQSNDLYQLIFAPLQSALGKSRQLFLSPDGSLNLIPFEVLRDDKGRYLIETHTIHYVSAGRDIAGYGMIKEKGQKALLIGDPDFNLAAKQTDGEKPVTRSRQMQGLTFSRLPGTKEEVEAIAAIMGRSDSDTYTGETARESVLLRKESPRILHLATHGFFLSDQDWSSLMDEKTRGITIAAKEAPSGKKAVRTENPFLRAGLALAGANRSLVQEGVAEGILTAEKILGLNLRGTDMVVLSACETGVGDVKNGEGVYGLRRAFTQAGAKSLVMSLWEVPDRETKELMVSFYQNLQSGKMNRVEALRHAALKQRETVKARYGSDNPYYWGAFVFLGEAE